MVACHAGAVGSGSGQRRDVFTSLARLAWRSVRRRSGGTDHWNRGSRSPIAIFSRRALISNAVLFDLIC